MAMPSGTLATPIGTVVVTADGDRLSMLRIEAGGAPSASNDDAPLIREAIAQLAAWFAGRLLTFDLPLVPVRTPRGQALRDAIAGIDAGQTLTYGALARVANSSPRAIGQACARNPLPIIIPCHRVTASDDLGHYSAGAGVPTKRWLLAHEERHAARG